MKQSKHWTHDMYRQVLDEYPFKGQNLAKEMGVNADTLQHKATILGASCHYDITDEEKGLITRYGRTLGQATIFLMPDHTPAEIRKALCDAKHWQSQY